MTQNRPKPTKSIPAEASRAVNQAAYALMQAEYPRIRAELLKRVQDSIDAGRD